MVDRETPKPKTLGAEGIQGWVVGERRNRFFYNPALAVIKTGQPLNRKKTGYAISVKPTGNVDDRQGWSFFVCFDRI